MQGGDSGKLAELCAKPHKEQAVWFLNAFWKSFASNEAEKVWTYMHKFAALDPQHPSAVDEFSAHRFLEQVQETLTVHAMRDRLRATGAIGPTDHPKLVPFTHYLLWKYSVDWHTLVNASQGDNQEEVARAQRMLEDAQAAVEEARRTASEAAEREAELAAALAELHAQENAYNAKTEDLKRKSETLEGVVARNKAKNELAQHTGEDPLPLRRAKITTEAATKRAERARAAAEAALAAAEKMLVDAQEYLDEVKSKPGSAQGALWWIDRELHEAKAYLPSAKGGYTKPK